MIRTLTPIPRRDLLVNGSSVPARAGRARRVEPGGLSCSGAPEATPRSRPWRAILKLIDHPELRERVGVFRDRAHAGEVLAGLLEAFRGTDAIVLAIPAGGYPVAAEIATRLGLPLDVAVVSKITPSWNTEAGYGAVAFDGTMRINEPLAAQLDIRPEERRAGIDAASRKVARRVALLRGNEPGLDLSGRRVILVDDGLATGFTMLVAIEALEKVGAGPIAVAVPTGHVDSVRRIAGRANAVYCANLRGGPRFAVAEAYQRWHDLTDEDIFALREARKRPGAAAN